MLQIENRSSAHRRLLAATACAGVEVDKRDALVGAVLRELGVRMTPVEWRELCGWLPWDVRSLAGARHADRVAPREDLVTAVATASRLPRLDAVVAVHAVLAELGRILPPQVIPARLAVGVPGL